MELSLTLCLPKKPCLQTVKLVLHGKLRLTENKTKGKDLSTSIDFI